MAFSQLEYDNDVVRVSACGHVEASEVELILMSVRDYAESVYGAAVDVVIDARLVEFITTGARIAFAEGGSQPFLNGIHFQQCDSLLAQTIRTIQLLAPRARIDVEDNAPARYA